MLTTEKKKYFKRMQKKTSIFAFLNKKCAYEAL